MNPLTPTPLRALPNNGELLHPIQGQLTCLPVLSNRSTILPWELGCFSFAFSHLYHAAPPPLTCCDSRSPLRTIGAPDVSRISFLPPPSHWPPLSRHLCFLSFESALVLLHSLSGLLGDAFSDVFSQEGLFGSPHRSLRVTSVYLLHTNRPPYRSISPVRFFSFLPYPNLVLGDFNLHRPLADPCRSLSEREFVLFARYLDVAFNIPYHLLNTSGVYTCFQFDTISRASILDLAFGNTTLSPLVSLWDTPLPSTGSDHVPCLITLKLPVIMLSPPLHIGPSSTCRR